MRARIDVSDTRVGPDRVLRIAPRGADPALRLLYLHGGGYVHEVKPVQWGLTAGLIERVPATVIAPVYPLAPEHTCEDGLACAERVYLAAAEEVGAAGVVVYGDSAGGGLAEALVQRLRDAGRELPAAVVLFSPWLDAGVTGPDQPELARHDPMLTIPFLHYAARAWAGELSLDDPRVSPLYGDRTGLPPTLVFSGGRDILGSDARRFAERNPEVVLRRYPGMIHVWPAAPIPEGRQALDEAAAFIREHTGRSGAA